MGIVTRIGIGTAILICKWIETGIGIGPFLELELQVGLGWELGLEL